MHETAVRVTRLEIEIELAPDDRVRVGMSADARVEVPGFGPVWLHRAVHQWGDTKHRRVTYRFRASTRYREYFDPETLAPRGRLMDTLVSCVEVT